MKPPALVMTDVCLDFQRGRNVRQQRFRALKDVSFTLRHGEKMGIVGRNGAGKSTLLRVMAGVLRPDSGKVERNHGRCQLLTLGLGFLGHLSGRQNAILNGLLMGFERREIDARLDEIREFSELGDFFEQPIETYSSGMRSRLAFSTAIQLEPDVLLLDEVLSVGDGHFRVKSKEAIQRRLQSDATIVLVSHDERILNEICDRILWLDEGRSVADGPPADILPAYVKTYAKRAPVPIEAPTSAP